MKKILLPLGILLLASFMLIGMVQAANVSVTAVPDVLHVGETTTIIVTCDQDASGSITVTTPVTSTPYTVPITVSAGVPLSLKFPDDFTGASSTEVGEYTVEVSLSGAAPKFTASFYVYFNVNVAPEIAMVGTAGATVAMLSGLGLFIVKKRRTK